MNRAGNLYNSIADIENLRLAFWKAKRGKEAKLEVVNFSRDLDINLNRLRELLLEEKLALGDYHYFTIYDPKERVICAASFPERILHHAIMNVCHPVFEKFQIFESYATRPGKGQYAALERAKIYNRKHHWFFKLDIRKYFDSISHQLLYSKVERLFKDKKLLNLFKNIIDSYQVTDGFGIPIGNLTSQYFANYFLGFADHFIKEVLNVKAYVRYMDDMVIWGDDKAKLLCIKNQFISYIEDKLDLNIKPATFQRVEKGLPFLGYVLFSNNVRLNRNSKKRFLSKYKDYTDNLEKNIWSQKDFANHITPLISFAQYANSQALIGKHVEETEAS